MKNILITTVDKDLPKAKELIVFTRMHDADAKVFGCDMNPSDVSVFDVFDECFKVPICTSEDYVETIWSLCLGHNIGLIIPMIEKEFIILSANTELFAKYGVQVIHQGHTDDNLYGLGKENDVCGGGDIS